LTEDDLKLAFAVHEVTQITEADKIAKAMVIIFQDNKKVLGLLQAFIDEEVKTTGTLFFLNLKIFNLKIFTITFC
jgi:sugar diacid utilization regulator